MLHFGAQRFSLGMLLVKNHATNPGIPISFSLPMQNFCIACGVSIRAPFQPCIPDIVRSPTWKAPGRTGFPTANFNVQARCGGRKSINSLGDGGGASERRAAAMGRQTLASVTGVLAGWSGARWSTDSEEGFPPTQAKEVQKADASGGRKK